MKQKKILLLVHKHLTPKDEQRKQERIDKKKIANITEQDVYDGLKKLGHNVRALGVESDLGTIRHNIEEFSPHIVFNLLESFHGIGLYDQNVVSYLELLKTAYTGCNPRGLMIARDKALTKKILTYHKMKCPKFFVFPKNKKVKKPKWLNFPLIVKCRLEESSTGISQSSIVHNEEKLKERIEFINHSLADDAIVEEFVEGREIYVGIIGNYRLQHLPAWELTFGTAKSPEKEIYTSRAKFNYEYRKEKEIKAQKAKLSPELEKKIYQICKRAYKVLGLNGYGRIDLRITSENEIYILEANPNPGLTFDDEFVESAKSEGINYNALLNKIVGLGLTWHSYEV